jgi:hypothetical protein
MGVVAQIHFIFGERVLPLLLLVGAVWLTVTWKPGDGRTPLVRILPVLVDIQVTLGIIYWLYLIFTTSGATQAKYLGFPFILHPIIGIAAAGFAHYAVGPKSPFKNLGRYAPLAGLGVLLLFVVANIFIGISA